MSVEDKIETNNSAASVVENSQVLQPMEVDAVSFETTSEEDATQPSRKPSNSKKHRTPKIQKVLDALKQKQSEAECLICCETYNVDDLVTCAAENACTFPICHDCLVTSFLRPLKFEDGLLTEYDPTQCPHCQAKGAFCLDERDEAIVQREASDMYKFDAASVGASYASTSHEQGDLSDWEPSEEDEDEAIV